MYVISEKIVRQIATTSLAFDAVRKAFIAAHTGQGNLFPVVIAKGTREGNTFSVKSGNIADAGLSGLKTGSYWPENHTRGLPNHGSTTLLLDEQTGFVRALINAGYLNGLRTAAADAVACSVLARKNSQTLGVIGAGHQAIFEVQAVCEVRDINSVLVTSRSEQSAKKAVETLTKGGISAEVADTRAVCQSADILITATNARAPLFENDWINLGTHISAMGADQSGKQELPVEFLRSASLFADMPEQSRVIGEFEIAAKANPDLNIQAIGAVLNGEAEGRRDEDQITVFDSSGIALQDLCVAEAVLQAAVLNGALSEVEF